jgi:hypothetical protein
MSFLFEGVFHPISVNQKIAQYPQSHQSMICDIQAADLMRQINLMATGQAKTALEAAERARCAYLGIYRRFIQMPLFPRPQLIYRTSSKG